MRKGVRGGAEGRREKRLKLGMDWGEPKKEERILWGKWFHGVGIMRERERIFGFNYFDFIEWSSQLSRPNPKYSLSLCDDVCFSWQLATNSQQPMRLYYGYTLTNIHYCLLLVIGKIYHGNTKSRLRKSIVNKGGNVNLVHPWMRN